MYFQGWVRPTLQTSSPAVNVVFTYQTYQFTQKAHASSKDTILLGWSKGSRKKMGYIWSFLVARPQRGGGERAWQLRKIPFLKL